MHTTTYDFSTFKRDINLPAFAATFGYEIDRKKTTKTTIAMKSANNKVLISKKGGAWVYWSVFDEQDNGTIVDFIANRSSKSIPEIGRMLSEWSGQEPPTLPEYRSVESQTYDTVRVQSIFKKCRPIQKHTYLARRGLCSKLLTSDRFTGRIFTDRYRNVAFPHYQNKEVCGLELKNAERGLLVKGSQKTFWRSNTKATDTVIVVTEAVIDALSYQQLFQPRDAMYLSTGGGVSQRQCQLLADLLTTDRFEKVVVATDNDQGGDRIANRVNNAIKHSEFAGKISRHRPLQTGMDWNDVLLSS